MMQSLSSATVLALFLLFLLLKDARCSVRQLKLYEFQRKLLQKTSPPPSPSSRGAPPNYPKTFGVEYYPIGYGADHTGLQDSTDAIMAALSDAVKVRTGGRKMLPGINDLGGVILDFQGGTFKISRPIRFPANIGNVVVQGGTLRASDDFPTDRHLIELWANGTTKPPQSDPNDDPPSFVGMKNFNRDGNKYEDITFRDILFDSSLRGGGLLILSSIRIRVTDSFFLNFTTEGIRTHSGHETLISNCFLGQHPTDGGDPTENRFGGTAIDIASNDNAVTDVVVFSAAYGIVLSGGANILTGVHCYNKASGFGGVGIFVHTSQNRIVSPYMDYNDIVVVDPKQVLISNGFFLGGGCVVLKAKTGRISGLTVVDNMFSGSKGAIVKIEGGEFKNIDQVVVDRNVAADGMGLRSTVASMAVAGVDKTWSVDFSGVLLFPNKINHVEYSFYLKSGGIGSGLGDHAVTSVSKNVVVIGSRIKANAVVSVRVDQYNMVGEKSLDSM